VETVDARGLACPLPLALAKRRMERLAPGEALVVLATDREAPIDIAAWAAIEGHRFEERRTAGWFELVVRKVDAAGGGVESP
jgi:tRNA 2-thiouridine synthesizing protein A